MADDRYQTAERVAWAGIVGNLVLTVLQVGLGLAVGSIALLANGIHTGIDIMGAVALFLGMRVASQPADSGHPYGHARAETIVQNVVATLVILAGVEIGWISLNAMLVGVYHRVPDLLALGGAFLAIVLKEALYRYTIWAARITGNKALFATALDHRADVYASVATLAGVGGARMGFPYLDPAMGLGISLLVVWGGWKMARDAVEDLMDGFMDQEFLDRVRAVTGGVPGVRSIQVLKARRMGPFVLLDTEIGVAGEITVEAGHRVAEEVRRRVRADVEGVADCMVHVNPVKSLGKNEETLM